MDKKFIDFIIANCLKERQKIVDDVYPTNNKERDLRTLDNTIEKWKKQKKELPK